MTKNPLRQGLIFLRKQFNADSKKFYIMYGAATLVALLVTFLVDLFLPFSSSINLVRSVLLIPTSLVVFATLYGVSLDLHHRQIETSEEGWVPFRSRYSLAWRYRIAAVVSALVFVFALSIQQNNLYTFTSSLVGVAVIALLAFVRSTTEEESRSRLGIPDARDLLYEEEKRRRLDEYEARLKSKKRSKKSHGDDDDD